MAGTSTPSPQAGQWMVESVEKNEDGLDFYLSRVRPFRLRMLQVSPGAFSSTFARESAFDDATWQRRALDPLSHTFVAAQGTSTEERTILSMLTLRGPFPMPGESNLPDALRQARWGDLKVGSRPLLRWHVYSVFTDPGARRRGIGTAVLAAAMRHALAESIEADADCVLVLGILGQDGAVRSFYEKAGFRVLGEDEEGGLELVRCISKSPILENPGVER